MKFILSINHFINRFWVRFDFASLPYFSIRQRLGKDRIFKIGPMEDNPTVEKNISNHKFMAAWRAFLFVSSCANGYCIRNITDKEDDASNHTADSDRMNVTRSDATDSAATKPDEIPTLHLEPEPTNPKKKRKASEMDQMILSRRKKQQLSLPELRPSIELKKKSSKSTKATSTRSKQRLPLAEIQPLIKLNKIYSDISNTATTKPIHSMNPFVKLQRMTIDMTKSLPSISKKQRSPLVKPSSLKPKIVLKIKLREITKTKSTRTKSECTEQSETRKRKRNA